MLKNIYKNYPNEKDILVNLENNMFRNTNAYN